MPMTPMPADSAGAPPADNQLAGQDPAADPTEPQGPTPEDAMKNVGRNIRQIHTQIGAIAQQFPEFAKFARQAQDALMAGAVAIVGKQRGPSQAGAPPIG